MVLSQDLTLLNINMSKIFHFYVITPAEKLALSMIIRIFAAREPAKPLNDAQMRGVFLYIYVHSQNTPMERLPHFTKK